MSERVQRVFTIRFLLPNPPLSPASSGKTAMTHSLGAGNGPAEQRRPSVLRAGIRRRPSWRRLLPVDKESNVRFQEVRRVPIIRTLVPHQGPMPDIRKLSSVEDAEFDDT